MAIRVRDLWWKYEHTAEFALRGVSLEVAEGEFVGIVGPNESGKTTLAYALKGLIPHAFHGIWRGEVEVFGASVRTATVQQLARHVGLVFSDPEAQFTAMTVEDEIVFGLENLGLGVAAIEERLRWAAALVGVERLLDKSPFDISGGEKQRVAIAAVLAMQPRVLILDEPTSMLDPLGKDLIFSVLRRLKDELAITILVVEHNIERLALLADRMILVEGGQVVRDLPTRDFFRDVAFLRERHVEPPDVTTLFAVLQDRGWDDGPLPLALEEAVGRGRLLLQGGARR